MEINFSVAIYHKLKQNINGHFVFNNGAFPVTAQEFQFLDSSNEIPDLNGAYNFAKTYNFIPTTVNDILNKSVDPIDEICEKVAAEAKAAQKQDLTPANQKTLEDARRFLFQKVLLDGNEIALFDNYQQYQLLWTYAKLAYNRNESDLRSLTVGSAERIALENKRPILQQKIDVAEVEWRNKGGKQDVENALGVISQLEQKSSQTEFNKWCVRLNQDKFNDAVSGAAFRFTGFIPKNFYKPNVIWNSMTLDAKEVKELLDKVPASMKNLINKQLEVKTLEFEYTEVSIIREWLDDAFFTKRFWKFADNSVISSGGETPVGLMPAIPMSIIFARVKKVETGPKTFEDGYYYIKLANNKALQAPETANQPCHSWDFNKSARQVWYVTKGAKDQYILSAVNNSGQVYLTADNAPNVDGCVVRAVLDNAHTLNQRWKLQRIGEQGNLYKVSCAATGNNKVLELHGDEPQISTQNNLQTVLWEYMPAQVDHHWIFEAAPVPVRAAEYVKEMADLIYNDYRFQQNISVKKSAAAVTSAAAIVTSPPATATVNTPQSTVLTDASVLSPAVVKVATPAVVKVATPAPVKVFQNWVQRMDQLDAKSVKMATLKMDRVKMAERGLDDAAAVNTPFHIIGFICQKLPLCPNPDPALTFL
jgi:hypothetical protein